MLEKIDKFISSREYQKAMDYCNHIEAQNPEIKFDIIRKKAEILFLQSYILEAYQHWEALIKHDEANMSDYYLASQCLISLKRYEDAIDSLLKLLDLCEKENEVWFLDANLYFLSYCYAKQRDHKNSLRFLNIVKESAPDFEIPMPDSDIVGDLECLEEFIERIHE